MEPASLIFKNGERVSGAFNERALAYADGVFETMRVVSGRIPLWPYHEARLKTAASKLKFNLDLSELRLCVDKTLACLETGEAIIKLVLSRGAESRGSYALINDDCDVLTHIRPPRKNSNSNYIELISVQEQLSNTDDRLLGLKLMYRLPYILPTVGMNLESGQEALFYDVEGCPVETMHHNLFILNERVISGPLLDACGVHGVMRAYLKDRASDFGFAYEVRALSKDDLVHAEGIFVSNAIDGLVPVKALDGIKIDVPDVLTALCNDIQKALN